MALRPQRIRAAPLRLEDEQEDSLIQAWSLLDFRQAVHLSSRANDSDEDNDIPDRHDHAEDDDDDDDEDDVEEVKGDDDDSKAGEKERLMRVKEKQQGWTTQHTPVVPRVFSPPSSSTIHPPSSCSTALDHFHLIIPPDFIHHIANQMNLFAQQQLDAEKENMPPATRAQQQHRQKKHHWYDTTAEEVQAFIGCFIYMGMVVIGDTHDYWKGVYEQPFISQTFPRDRFLDLIHYFHLADNTQYDPSAPTKLHKLEPLITTVRQQSRLFHYPSQYVTVDEAMVGFKGRSSMRQHIAAKAHSTGYKVWMLVECDSGYVYNFEIYEGKGATSEEGQAGRVVQTLIEPLHKHSYHVVAMDGFFSSVSLFQQLYDDGFYALGTTRNNRKLFPKSMLAETKGLSRGQWVYRQKGDMVVVSWMDKKPVNLLSTCCDPLKEQTVKRRSGREELELACPEVVIDYHQYMRGVDLFSQYQSYYAIGRRAKKWWPRLAWFLIDVGLINARILYNIHTKSDLSQKQFREMLMQELVGGFSARRKRGRPYAYQKPPADTVVHIPMKRSTPTDCVVCRKSSRTTAGRHASRTREGCRQCDVAVHIACWERHLSVDEGDDSDDEAHAAG